MPHRNHVGARSTVPLLRDIVARGRILQLIRASPHFVREHGFEYINLKEIEDKKTTIKTALDVYGESFRKTKHPEVNLKKRNLYNILYLKYY